MTDSDNPAESKSVEREKWEAEKAFREREVTIKEKELATREAELEIKRNEQGVSRWRSPLVVAIIAAAMAGLSNAVVSVVNGSLERGLESEKSEQTRILEMIKTGDPDKAANNLQFLLEAGLISDQKQRMQLQDFLNKRKPGSGPTLPSANAIGPQSIVGTDDAVEVTTLPPTSSLKRTAGAVGQLKITSGTSAFVCTAFLVADDLVLTASRCVDTGLQRGQQPSNAFPDSVNLLMNTGSERVSYEVILPPVELIPSDDGLNYALLRVKGNPGAIHGSIRLSATPPKEKQPLSLLMFRGTGKQLAVTGAADCNVLSVENDVFHHLCDTGGGSSGAPLLSADGSQVLGLHFLRDQRAGVAVRIDRIISRSHVLQSLPR
ncbi:MAG: trypsin-like peptidase domain-containing protein [Acidobacteriota bacterium]